MDRQQVIDRLLKLPQEIEETEVALLDAQVGALAAKETVADREAELLVSGVIDGKNAETRSAQVRAATEAERLAAREAENAVSRCGIRFTALCNEFKALISAAALIREVA